MAPARTGDLRTVNSRDPVHSLPKLREDLRRFDESGYLDRHPYGMEIRQMLLSRIADLEAAVQDLAELAKSVGLAKPPDKPTDDG